MLDIIILLWYFIQGRQKDAMPKTAGVPDETQTERKVKAPAEEKFELDFYASRCLRGVFFSAEIL